MKKTLIFALILQLMLVGCANEYNRIYKTSNVAYRYEYAKECFANGKYGRATILLTDIISVGTTLSDVLFQLTDFFLDVVSSHRHIL